MSLQEEIAEMIESGMYNSHIDVDEIIDRVLDAAWPDIKTMQQALLECSHAQRSGPNWYTKGESGMYQQVRMWLDRGLKASEAINKLRSEK